MALLCKGTQGIVGERVLVFPTLFNGGTLGLKVGRLQPQGNFFLQVFAQLKHVLTQQAPLPSGHAKGTGFLRGIKVMQIAQIRGNGLGGGHLLHQGLHQRGAATAHLTQHKQVVVGLRHRQTKTGGRLRPRLPNPGQRQVQQFGGIGKTQ